MSPAAPKPSAQPIPSVWLVRLLVAFVIVFALAAGYYRSVLSIYHVRYVRLQTKYQLLEEQAGETTPVLNMN